LDREKLRNGIGSVITDLNYDLQTDDERRQYVAMSREARQFAELAMTSLRQAQFFLDLADGAEERHRREVDE
jgi:hypothetical protein